MTLLGDLFDAYALARGDEPAGEPPVPYTTAAESHSIGNSFLTTGDRRADLERTTSESTLFSVLELIAKNTAAVKWYGQRRVQTPAPDGTEPPRITGEQNLAVKLWNKPNKFMSGRYVRTMSTWHYRSVGEAWFVVDYHDQARTIPRSWWPVRPDRMWPVPDPVEYLTGYIYVGPDGQRVPLDLDEVMRITNPHPMDPHRGLGVVQTLGTALGIALSSAQWISKFFQNDATPGGIIEIPEGLPDHEYNQLRKRWNEQHRGVSKAHRIAILEYGKWTPRQFNMRDMQFTEVRSLTRDQVLEAFRIHKHKMGISTDVNLANAFAADSTFAKDELVPNLEEWDALAEDQFLPKFGAPGTSIQLCYENPVPADQADERADRAARVEDGLKLIAAGVDPAEAWEFVGLPSLTITPDAEPAEEEGSAGAPDPVEAPTDTPAAVDALAIATIAARMAPAVRGGLVLDPVEGRQILVDAGAPITPDAWVEPVPEPVPTGLAEVSPAVAGEDGAVPGEKPTTSPGDGAVPAARRTVGVRAESPASGVDLTKLDEDWQVALGAVMARWPGILDDQYSALADQVRGLIDAGDLAGLVDLATPDAGAADVLTAVLVTAAGTGAAAVVAEAAAQGVRIGAAVPARAQLETLAVLVTGLMRAGLATSAAREALRVAGGGGVSGADVADAVRTHLDGLTDAQPRQYLGGAVTAAQNQGRFSTLDVAPDADYYASEVLDANTCTPCSTVDGRKYGTLAVAKEDYPLGGYRNCAGAERCRGTIVAVWTEGQV